MPQQNRTPTTTTESLIKQAQPLMQMVTLVCAVLIWGYNTFALKETVNDLRSLVATQKIELQQYSDNNRKRMEERVDAILLDIRDQLQYLRTMINKQR